MAYVDLGQLSKITLKEGWWTTVWNTAPGGDFFPGQWYRAAPWLDWDNSPSVSIIIGDSGTTGGRSGEALWLDNNGNVNVAMTLKNVGKGTATIGINWLSAPQVGE
jgi:hypothetical protein